MSLRSPFKWPGGKFQVIGEINPLLPVATTLHEPFLGGGSVFLNTDYDHYVLNDINADLINVFKTIKKKHNVFINDLRPFFEPKSNNEQTYYANRDKFNESTNIYEKALLFVYLNRHGYNGLCRYNKSKGEYNVPFGKFKNVYFPETEIKAFAYKAKKAKFTCKHFRHVFKQAKEGSVIYCDPPYYPLNKTACFTGYSKEGFSIADQHLLVELAEEAKARGVSTIISNHNVSQTRKLYENADSCRVINVKRTISQNIQNRKKVEELLVCYSRGDVSNRSHLST